MTYIDNIIKKCIGAADCADDVVIYLKSIDSKLQSIKLVLAKNKENDTTFLYYLIKIEKIEDKILPSMMNNFLDLQIDFRNTKIIKDDLTPKDLLINNLNQIYAQLKTIENEMSKSNVKDLLITDKIIANNQVELAPMVNIEEKDLFTNKFVPLSKNNQIFTNNIKNTDPKFTLNQNIDSKTLQIPKKDKISKNPKISIALIISLIAGLTFCAASQYSKENVAAINSNSNAVELLKFVLDSKDKTNLQNLIQTPAPIINTQNIPAIIPVAALNNNMAKDSLPKPNVQRQVEQLLTSVVKANTQPQATPEDVEKLLQMFQSKIKNEQKK